MLRKTVVARALSIAFGVTALSVAVAPTAHAQSSAAGTVFGHVPGGNGNTVVLKNLDTNLTRTVTIDGSGNFQATALPIGRYRATLMQGSKAGSSVELDVLAGQGAEAAFATGAVQTVEVTARRSRIDVSRAENGATFTAKELARLPIAKTVDAIVQLAPNTTRGDPTYVAGSSLGGGAASENAYYINGFPVTNPLSQLGGSELPFGAIAQAQILTGGYGAEFGRSTGGVINITTKSGTNSWEVGGFISAAPSQWRSKYHNYMYAHSGLAGNTTDDTVRVRREENKARQTQVSAWVGGPIIKDKLFMFAAVEQNEVEQNLVNQARTSTTLARNGWVDRIVKTTRYLAKVDWNLSDNHRLELTLIGDDPSVDSSFRSYTYGPNKGAEPGTVGATVVSSQHEKLPQSGAAPNGGEDQILRYVGNLTDNLTLTAMAGNSKAVHIFEPTGYDPKIFSVNAPVDAQIPGLNYNNPQGFAGQLNKSGATDKMESYRLDLEYKIGDHTARAGLDRNKISALGAGTALGGGGSWVYQKTKTPNGPTAVSGGTLPALTSFGARAAEGYYVAKTLSSSVSNAYAEQTAWYVEDRWQVTKDLLITAGVRNEGFSNANQDNVKFVEQKNQWAPRLSAAWDVNGDASFKVFGSAGRYTIQMPSVIALRQANGSLNTSEYYAYTGTDSNGLPTGLTKIAGPFSANNEFGQAKDPKTISATNLKPAYQDELTLGLEKAWSPDLNFGAKFTYRTLKSTIDDWGDARPFEAYAKAHNIDTSHWEGFGGGLINPGQDNEFMVDFAGNGTYTKIMVSAADMGFAKPKRVYSALDVFLEHPYRNGWYGRINYTLGRSKGNTEGQTLSDTATAQADVSITQTWDYKELMYYAEGLLPNDRKHQIKAFGYYDLTPEWTIGAGLLIASGRPRSCFGTSPIPDDVYTYNSSSHFCFGDTAQKNVPSPRGTVGRLPWDKQMDVNLVYKPTFINGLALKLDVFNIFNSQTLTKVDERYNNRSLRVASYESVIGLTPPRSLRVSAEFNHKF